MNGHHLFHRFALCCRLFPIQEKGMNWQSYVLTKQEIKVCSQCFSVRPENPKCLHSKTFIVFQHFRKDKIAKQNLLKSYELMLDFYGIRLVNKKTGDVKRADNWKERFDNMNRFVLLSSVCLLLFCYTSQKFRIT